MAFSENESDAGAYRRGRPCYTRPRGNVLEADGFAVLTAKNGEEGVRLARERCPAVILLDLALPTHLASMF